MWLDDLERVLQEHLLKKENNNMLKKLKTKICKIICKIFKITPCVCDHECNCKKENK
jgi:hypothetical protein